MMGTAAVPLPDLNTEALFRHTMGVATDLLWELRADEPALAALYGVLDEAKRQQELGGTDDLFHW